MTVGGSSIGMKTTDSARGQQFVEPREGTVEEEGEDQRPLCAGLAWEVILDIQRASKTFRKQ